MPLGKAQRRIFEARKPSGIIFAEHLFLQLWKKRPRGIQKVASDHPWVSASGLPGVPPRNIVRDRVKSVKMVESGPPKSVSLKTTRNWQKLAASTISEFWKLTTIFSSWNNSRRIYSSKLAESYKEQALQPFNLLYPHATLASPVVALKTNNPLSGWRLIAWQPSERKNGQEQLQSLINRIVITWSLTAH